VTDDNAPAYEYSPRSQTRRDEDHFVSNQVVLMQQEIQNLKQRLIEDERGIKERLKALETASAEFNRKFTFGKGIFYGSIAVLGTLGVVMVDRIKDLMALVK